ncbi:hypothetical protein [Mucilaginibacter sp. UYCu711]|uniref:hypothetical protein n=1 Tax=Mucilaginibacter sp. UYCu711 TaxID=3156339 RepID=UPI003D1E28D8
MKNAILLIACTLLSLGCFAQRFQIDESVDVAKPAKLEKLTKAEFLRFKKEKLKDSVLYIDNVLHNAEGNYRIGDVLVNLKVQRGKMPPTRLLTMKKAMEPEPDEKRDPNSVRIETINGRQILLIETQDYGMKSYIFYTINEKNTILVHGIIQGLVADDEQLKSIIANFVRTARYKD